MDFSGEVLLRTLQDLPRPPCYRIAFSGGLDSTCLLHALASLRERLDIPLEALHLDHGLHTDSGRWAAHCREVCEGFGIALRVRVLEVRPIPGMSLEALARQARLTAYQAQLGKDELLLTAQHQDDQAETLLLQLLRGSGLAGLAAMPQLTALPPGWLARPLLTVTRAQLHAYARCHQLTWLEDPSNSDTHFDRNYLRHRVFPLLTQRWPACAATLARSAGHCAEAMELLEQLTTSQLERVRGNRPGTLSVAALSALEPALCRALLRRWIREQGRQVPDSRRLDRIRREVLCAAPDRSPRVDWADIEVRRYRNELFLLGSLPPPPAGPIAWPQGTSCRLPVGLGSLHLHPTRAAGLDPVRWNRSVATVRFGATGERCRAADTAHRTRLKDLYRRHAVPNWLRPYVPLVYLDGELIAVAGVCLCDHHLVEGEGLGLTWDGHPFLTILGTPPSAE